MKHVITEKIQIPEGVSCIYENKILKCSKDSKTLERKIKLLQAELTIQDNEITLHCKRGNKNNHKIITSNIAHIKNLFLGLQEKFVYHLEACNVHFPMTLKADGDKLVINNFLGEKVPRHAKILPNVDVEIKGHSITVFSHDKEAAGQTAANFEKATKLTGRDRRIFQDGIFIIEKPGRRK